ncbi:hypothetical protein J437_LFUL017165, partial [Ladona fulva]
DFYETGIRTLFPQYFHLNPPLNLSLYVHNPNHLLFLHPQACPLNPRRPLVAGLTPDPNGRGEDTVLQDFSQRFSPAIRGVVEFAKRIPGFALLSQSDQVTLLKAGVFEVLLLRLACLFDAQTNTMTCLNGELLRRESIVSHSPSSSPSHSPSSHSSNARFLVDSMFEFAARLNSLQLSDAELALFSAVVIIAPDRPGLRHTDLISRIHSRLLSSLSLLLSRNHPSPPSLLNTLQSYIPDLRTLNTLHSEKLLAFKMTEQQNQSAEEHRGADVDQEQYARVQGCPAHAMQVQFPLLGDFIRTSLSTCLNSNNVSNITKCACFFFLQNTDAWKDDDVQEVEDDEIIEEEERWRANPRSATLSAVMSGVKSPLGSVSSSESVCSGEVASLSEFRSSVSASAPLLAASLSGNTAAINALAGFPKRRRHRDRSGSNSEEDTSCSIQGTTCPTQVAQIAHRTYFRKLDSPSDSGIESGTERLEKSSTSTSVCSSPRSSLEDKDEALLHQHKPPQRRCPHLERPSVVEDMPVLKRVLQAPPLYDTNSLMDEAYKPHKKFRALRKDCAEAEPMGNSPTGVQTNQMMAEPPRGCRMQEKTPYATLEPVRMDTQENVPSPPIVVLSPPAAPPAASPHSIISTLNMHFPQITIHAQPMRNPSPIEPQACNSANRLSPHAGSSNPPLLLQKALLQPPANQRSLQSQQHQALLSALSGDTSPRPASSSPLTASLLSGPTLSSSLSSTHSTLARSLMEGPKMTAEQMKRTDIIHSYIMREGAEEASGSQYRKPQVAYQTKSSPEPIPDERRQQYRKDQPSQAPGVLVFNGSYVHMGWNKQGPSQDPQYAPTSPKPEVKQGGQPLNLSKKTPPPSPATTPVAASVLEA